VPCDGTLNAYYVYQSKVVYALTNDPATAQGAYGIVSLAAGLSGKGSDFKISLFVNNLFDKQYYTRIDNRTSPISRRLNGSHPAAPIAHFAFRAARQIVHRSVFAGIGLGTRS
jgi:outer membrane receptor protein involved in Fe transport